MFAIWFYLSNNIKFARKRCDCSEAKFNGFACYHCVAQSIII
ncbi:SWIM zinc finger family protein [Pseudoalteromonas sp. KG3]